MLVALLGVHHLSEVGQSLDRLADARIATAATAAARTLDDDVARFARLAQEVGPGDVQGDRLALTARLLRMQIALPGTSEVFAATAGGRLIAASDPLPAAAPDLAQQDWFAAALHPQAAGMSIALVVNGATDWSRSGRSLMLTVPVRDATGRVVGLVGAALPPADVRRLLDRAPLPTGADLRLLGPGEAVLAASNAAPPPSGSVQSAVEPARLIARIALRGAPPTLSASAPLHLVPARIVASMPQAAAWSSGWPVLRGDVAGFALELLGLWSVLAVLLLSRGWLGRGGPAAAGVGGSVASLAAPDSATSGPVPGSGAIRGLSPDRGGAAAGEEAGPRSLALQAEARAESAEAALAAARHAIETARRDQELALAAVGHDMRTPMQSVLGICDLLLDGALEDDQRHWVEQLRASGAALLALLNGLLAIAGGTAAQAEATDLIALLQEAVALFAAQAEGKRIALVTRLDPALRGSWRVDAARLRQIVVNLLANAVSRTASGGVELRAAPESAPDGRGMIRITVADTGPGISPEDQSRIFERFQRADPAPQGRDKSRDQGVTPGLGLVLCRENARALGGTLTLDSQLGEGAAFTLVCPADQDPSEARRAAFAGRAALIVGLPEASQAALRDRLAQLGFAVETAADGYVGLALAERTVALHGVLDLVIADLGVTGMAADSFCLRLRSTAFGKSLALVGLVDQTQGGGRLTGVDALLPRDAAVAEIVAAATALIAEQPALSALLPASAAVGGGRILIVEDDETNRALLGAALARSGFTAFPAASGEEAVRMAEHDGLDAVLLDLLLPGIDGLETARRIRDLPGRSASIPIIALTARAGAFVEAECRAAGLTAMVAKPADLDRLAQRLRGWIAAAPRAAAGPGGEEGAPASPVALVSGPFLEAMVSEIGLERTRACVQEFLDEAGTKCVRLAELIPGWEAGAVLRLCDDLKGLADLFGAVGFSEVIEDLAAAVTSGAREPAAEAMARLEAGLPALPEAIWACLSGIERRRAERGRRAA